MALVNFTELMPQGATYRQFDEVWVDIWLRQQNLTLKQLNKGLVAYFKNDLEDIEGSTLKDRSGLGNNGTIFGATVADGKINEALSFDGVDDYIKINDFSSADPQNAITISLWCKIISASPSVDFLLNRRSTNTGLINNGYKCFDIRYSNANTFLVQIALWDKINSGTLYSMYQQGTIPYNEWHNVILRWSNLTNRLELFIDGILNNSIATAYPYIYYDHDDPVGTDDNSLYVATFDSLSNFLNGSIDEARVYNRALTDKEIKALYEIEKVGFNQRSLNSGLVLYMKFEPEDINGTTVYDRSSKRNHGTLAGTTQVDGAVGKARQYDGVDDKITVVDSAGLYDFAGTEPYSFSFLFKRDSTGGTSWNSLLSKRYKDASNRFQNWIITTDPLDVNNQFNLILQRWVDGTSQDLSTVTNLNLDTWYHGIIVYDGNKGYVYVNGNLDNTVTFTNSLLTSTVDLTIGLTSLKGILDEVRIYNRALSAEEAKSIYLIESQKFR